MNEGVFDVSESNGGNECASYIRCETNVITSGRSAATTIGQTTHGHTPMDGITHSMDGFQPTMVKVPPDFVVQVLMPMFLALSAMRT